jgi:creatinine amidohydrolase
MGDDQVLVEYELMTPDDVLVARRRAAVVFVPIGPLEWHGPHLPLGTDGLVPHRVAVEVARETGGVVLPTSYIGTDGLRPRGMEPQGLGALGLADAQDRVQGMDLPGFPVKSMYFHETVFGTLIRETVRLLKREPWSLIVLVNGHGAPNQQRMLSRIADEETDPPALEVLYLTTWIPNKTSGAGHADRAEVSMMMAVAGDLVHVDRLPPSGEPLVYRDFGVVDGAAFDGRPSEGFAVPPTQDPRLSSAEEGQEALGAVVRHIVEIVKRRQASATSTSAGTGEAPR